MKKRVLILLLEQPNQADKVQGYLAFASFLLNHQPSVKRILLILLL